MRLSAADLNALAGAEESAPAVVTGRRLRDLDGWIVSYGP